MSRLPYIPAERVVLRWLEGDDVDALYTIFSDPDVVRYWGFSAVDPVGARQLLDDIHQHFRTGDLYQWGIALRSDDSVIGTCTLAQIDWANRRAELGFALGSAHWKRGYVTEALHALLDHAFDEMNLHRLEADVDPRNGASIRVLERIGFQREGYMRERWLAGGIPADTIFYGLLRSDWKEDPVRHRWILPVATLVSILASNATGQIDQAPAYRGKIVRLHTNEPNPFAPPTVIRFDVPDGGRFIKLQVFDVLGRRVTTLLDERIGSGAHEARWNGTDDAGEPQEPGVYFYRLIAPGFEEVRRMLMRDP